MLVLAPTGRLAATLRAKNPHLDVDTIHGALLVFKPIQETLELMLPYDLIVIEEVGQLSQALFERIMQLWEAAEQLPTIVFVGDFWQLPGVEPTKATDSPMWHSVRVKKRELYTMHRCKCKDLQHKLEILRTGKPSVKQLRDIKKNHKAPARYRDAVRMNPEPTPSDVKQILAEKPETLFLTISRVACAKLNQWALDSLFADAAPLTTLPTCPEANVENYVGSKQVREEPLLLHVYEGMRIILTKNLNKLIGFVNGMGATVLRMGQKGLFVRTDQGVPITIHPWTSPEKVTHFPFRLGYASTLHKVQGATLADITIWLDIPNMPAAAYVALSRVEYDANWRFIGDPGIHHFTSARF